MEYVLLKIEGVDPEKIAVLRTGEDLPALYAERDRLIDSNGRQWPVCRYAVRLKGWEKWNGQKPTTPTART